MTRYGYVSMLRVFLVAANPADHRLLRIGGYKASLPYAEVSGGGDHWFKLADHRARSSERSRILDTYRSTIPTRYRLGHLHSFITRVLFRFLHRRGRSRFNVSRVTSNIDLFLLSLVAYPDGHPDHETDEAGELDYLKAKVDAGADFIFTQLFYDVEGFLGWMKRVREKGSSPSLSTPCGFADSLFQRD